MVSLSTLLPIIGYTGIAAVVFAESGMLVGFFLPGDSLLFTAGFLASQGIFKIVPLCILIFVAAVAGNSTGYMFGNRIGRKIFQKKDSLFFHRDNLLRAEAFYKKHGGKTIILAQFMPVIRTFAPILAGVGAMKYRKFVAYNLVGALLWGGWIALTRVLPRQRHSRYRQIPYPNRYRYYHHFSFTNSISYLANSRRSEELRQCDSKRSPASTAKDIWREVVLIV
jgi:membrane-associated protein